jgi:DNA mismatch repair ATPase MutL
MTKRLNVLEQVDINRLTAAVIVPSLSEVYLGLLQNSKAPPFRLTKEGLDGNSTNIEAFIDIDHGRMTVVDNGEGITPDILNAILKSSPGTYPRIRMTLERDVGTREKSLFSNSGSCAPFNSKLTLVLRALGYFSHTAIISRHHTYRQSYTLILSPSTESLKATASSRTTVGTTVTLKDLFANYPVRQSAFKANCQSEFTKIHKLSVAIGLSRPVTLTLRTSSTEKVVKIDRIEGEKWEKNVLEKGFSCNVSSWITFEGELDNVKIIIKGCFANTPRNHTFICTFPSQC